MHSEQMAKDCMDRLEQPFSYSNSTRQENLLSIIQYAIRSEMKQIALGTNALIQISLWSGIM